MAEITQTQLLGPADIDRAAVALRAFIAAEGVEALEDEDKAVALRLPGQMCLPLKHAAHARANGAVGAVELVARSIDVHAGLTEFNNALLVLALYADERERWDAICFTAALFEACGVDRGRVYGWLATIDASPEELAVLGTPMQVTKRRSLAEAADRLHDATSWRQRDFTLARRCYLALGAFPLSAERRARLLDIFQRRAENLKTMVLAAVLCVAVEVFALVYGFSEGATAGYAVSLACIVVCLAVLAAALLRFWRRPFNGLSALVPALYGIWLVCALMAVVARAL